MLRIRQNRVFLFERRGKTTQSNRLGEAPFSQPLAFFIPCFPRRGKQNAIRPNTLFVYDCSALFQRLPLENDNRTTTGLGIYHRSCHQMVFPITHQNEGGFGGQQREERRGRDGVLCMGFPFFSSPSVLFVPFRSFFPRIEYIRAQKQTV